jgi:DNA adenine methylase
MRYTTPLRYPGGKSKLANFIKLLFEENELLDGHYVEPFAGGAGIAFSLLFEEYATHIHINDLNPSVYSFWAAVMDHTDELCRLISDTPVTIEEWRRQQQVQTQQESHTIIEVGFSTFFLNRVNRSGIITGGVIGGVDQTGKWKIDARYNKENLISRIERIARYRSRITIYNLDAKELLRDVIPGLPDKTLVYLDPPYYVKGKALYQNHFIHEDHVSLAEVVKNEIKQNWVVSYDFVPEISNIYQEHRQIDYQLSYSAATRQKGSELMVFDDRLIIPEVSNPAKIKKAG